MALKSTTAAKRYQQHRKHSAKAFSIDNCSSSIDGGCSDRKKCVHLSSSIRVSSVRAWTAFVLLLSAAICAVNGQYHTTRDPRWYSREGDYNYHLPNPGDPDYRYV